MTTASKRRHERHEKKTLKDREHLNLRQSKTKTEVLIFSTRNLGEKDR